jgi:hypothetical protein
MNFRLSVAAIVLAVIQAGVAASNFYLGAWKIESAVIAPWWDDPAHKPDPAEMRGLVGKTITITEKAILGPRELACKGMRYRVKDYPADMLFEGAFGEMHSRNKSVDPVKMAATAGFRGGPSWKTVETGCGVQVNYHFIDANTAAIGLNNYIYVLKRQ